VTQGAQNVDVLSDHGETPLLSAAGARTVNLASIKVLVELGANIRATSPQGETPISRIVSGGRPDPSREAAVGLLLEKGIKLDEPSGVQDETVLELLQAFGWLDTIKKFGGDLGQAKRKKKGRRRGRTKANGDL